MMSEKRFTYKNGRITDEESKGDINISYNLNTDDGRKELCVFLNDREKMIESLNDDIARLHTAIDEYGIDLRNLHNQLRKQMRISNSYKEMTQLLMELIGEIEQ